MGHLDFALSVHRALAPDVSEQACWSPYSMAAALNLLTLGARGRTRDELVDLLGEDVEALAATLAESPAQDDDDKVAYAVANTLWVDAQTPVEQGFAAALSGGVRNAPFRAEPEKARDAINADVAGTTRDLIPELIPPGLISSDTIAALVNALYLKTGWRKEFQRSGTQDMPFHTPHGAVDVPTMRVSHKVSYRAQDGWQAVSIPAQGLVEATVLLPDAPLAEAEPQLTGDLLRTLLSPAPARQVALWLPKFSLDASYEAEKALQLLGIRSVFDEIGADLSGISAERLRVDTILHKAVLTIDEQGLEGAAATAAIMTRGGPPRVEEPVQVVVDRPFLFLVRHRAAGLTYFLARVVNPA
ncbi:serpin family protein [Actinokineospora bangkokensis]|uniref:Serpin domain-containing protein n=1 Tax=Actinokineospora bangkokensis TaxID=1193682 RepID=A0A1Q9LTR4_9PSEU|nr:serpin family protein [Actinokineospora bangkokensis]OLR95418.1 hypothetical protein BJP25_06630 [Actinokineospora bangkokensis]